MSIQVEVMLDLQSGDMPGTFHIIDKDEVKDFSTRARGRRGSTPRSGRSTR